ncbi:MAG: ribonuclease P protein component [Dehalococcoidia bacterium]|nr:ribonuclease P protein component [Dehalococcoidia bacterium]
MRPGQRLRRRSDFAAAYEGGRAYTSRLLVLRARPNSMSTTRFGFAVGKRLGNAVRRNRIRRRLRAIAGELKTQAGWDIVLIARAPTVDAEFASIRAAATTLVQQAGLLQGGEGTNE